MLLLPALAHAVNNGMQHQIPTAEYNALVAFYNSTGGAQWIDKEGWLNPNATTWEGVTVDGVEYDGGGNVTVRGHVQRLNFYQNNLVGTLPASLGSLTLLEALACHGNHLSGGIPASIASLTRLQLLWLQDNELTGTIPGSLGTLTDLGWLDLGSNQFTGTIPASLPSSPAGLTPPCLMWREPTPWPWRATPVSAACRCWEARSRLASAPATC